MFSRPHRWLAAWLSLLMITATLTPQTTWAAGDSGSTSSFWESFINALQNWLRSDNSGSSSSGNQTSDSGDEESAATDSDTTTTSGNITANTTEASNPATNTVQPTALAARIAGDAGGNANQYAFYAEKLSETLNKLTPAQRARVFGGQ